MGGGYLALADNRTLDDGYGLWCGCRRGRGGRGCLAQGCTYHRCRGKYPVALWQKGCCGNGSHNVMLCRSETTECKQLWQYLSVLYTCLSSRHGKRWGNGLPWFPSFNPTFAVGFSMPGFSPQVHQANHQQHYHHENQYG